MMKRNMFVGINRYLLLISSVLFILIVTTFGGMVGKWMSIDDETDLIEVEGIIWFKETSRFSASYFYIVDTEYLYLGSTGWQYNTSFHVNNVRPGEHVSPDLTPPGDRYSAGSYYRDYDEGDYFHGRLKDWHGEPYGSDVSDFVGFAFSIALATTILGYVIGRVRYGNVEFLTYEGAEENG